MGRIQMLVAGPAAIFVSDVNEPICGANRTLPEKSFVRLLKRPHQTEQILSCIEHDAGVAISWIRERSVCILHGEQPPAYTQCASAIIRIISISREIKKGSSDIARRLTIRRPPSTSKRITVADPVIRALVVGTFEPFFGGVQ